MFCTAKDQVDFVVNTLRSEFPFPMLVPARATAIVVPLALGALSLLGFNAGLIGPGTAIGVSSAGTAVVLVLFLLAADRSSSTDSAEAAQRGPDDPVAALGRTTRQLDRTNRELKHLTYVASHDLQEPLRAVSGCMHMLKEDYDDRLDAHAQELIRHAVEGTDRMSEMIEGLLACSRVGRNPDPQAASSSNDALRSALEALQPQIVSTGAAIDVGPLPCVRAPMSDVVTVFENIVGNALKFRSEDRALTVKVRAEERSGYCIFSVSDNGIGIAESGHERVFMLFQKLHSRVDYEGAGIGLALCKRLVEHYGGEIWVESAPGRGTTLFFTLPVALEEDAIRQQQA